MKQSILKFSGFALAISLFTACSSDDNDGAIIKEPDAITFKEMESDWVRLSLIQDDKIEVIQANSGEVKFSVDSKLAEGTRYYTSNSGRYLTAIHREGSSVRFFDSGIVNHEDHGHEYKAKWSGIELRAELPTHYAGTNGHLVIFNDGDGSISYINEAQLEIPSYTPETFVLENTVAHHGAGFRLDNGMFATTFKNTNEPGGIPQMVKFVDATGTVIDDNGGIEVKGIHGDAVNGRYGVFGSTDGVVLVDNKKNIDLIPNIEGLNSESGNWLGSLQGHDNSDLFFARSRNLGVYSIDPINKTMSNLYKGANVAGAMFSFDGTYYLVYTTDNKVHIYDGKTGNPIAERIVEMVNIPEVLAKKQLSTIEKLQKMEEPSPVLVCSNKFLYVLAPNRKQIKVLAIKDLTHVHTIELSNSITSIMKNGFSIEGDQNPDHSH